MPTKSTTLKLSADLALPLDYVTKTAAILAQRRKGKTYTASVLAEELTLKGMPWVALDPTGAWWGLRASANGKEAGMPVVIIGGPHGDLPLERNAGRLVADIVLDHPGYYVLDMKLLGSRAAEREFATDFGDRLYRRKMQPGMDFPMHLFVDEADMFVPQERERDEQKMLGVFQSIVRRGGLSGLGTTLISQRPALVNKSVLTQLDILILLRLVAGQDQDSVDKNYVSRAGTAEQRATLMGSLASLALGEAWVWEPGADPEPIFARVQVRERVTFNSSATPKVGERRRAEPTRLAPVELAALKESMAETLERLDADDPVKLRRRIRDLEERGDRLARERQVLHDELEKAVADGARKEVPVLTEEGRETMAAMAKAFTMAATNGLRAAEIVADLLKVETVQVQAPTAEQVAERMHEAVEETRARRQDREPRTPDPGEYASPARDSLSPSKRAVLDALTWFRLVGLAPVSKTQLALFAGTTPKSGTFGNNLGALRTAGLIDYPSKGMVAITPAGSDLAKPSDVTITTSEQLQDAICSRLSDSKARIVRALVSVYPAEMTRSGLATVCGTTGASGTYGNNLGSLRSLGVIDYPRQGYVMATPMLFLGDR